MKGPTPFHRYRSPTIVVRDGQMLAKFRTMPDMMQGEFQWPILQPIGLA
jgi:hypothetical protein